MITDTHDPRRGGAEKYFFRLKNALKKEGIQVYSLGFGKTNKKGGDFEIIKEHSSLAMRHFWRMFFNPIKYKQIRQCIQKIQPDVIHLHNINKYTISILKAVEGYNVVHTVHDYRMICPSLWNIHKDNHVCLTGIRLDCVSKHRRDNWFVYLTLLFQFYRRNRLLRKVVKKFIAPSVPLKGYLEKNGFSSVRFIPLFLDIKKKKGYKINPKQICFVGPLEENKAVELLLREFKTVSDKFPDVVLKIAGKGSQEQYLKQLTKDLGLQKKVSFLGWVQDVQKLYEQSAFVVMPSLGMEQFGLVAAEAMMYETPVIVSDRGGLPWLVKDGGIVFNPLRKGDLAQKMKDLLKRKSVRMGRSGRKRILTLCDKKNHLNQLIAVYKK